jgi:hypothetical protein
MKKQPMLRRRSAEVMAAKKEIAEEEATDRRNRLAMTSTREKTGTDTF